MAEGVQAPASVDWRTQNQVTPVKDQGQCGSCWAFVITGSTEGAYARKTDSLVALSEQQLIDCTTDINRGCNGGYLDDTFRYVISKGLQSESSYPYEGVDGTCEYSSGSVVVNVTTSGVFHNARCDSFSLNHGVLIVGYTSDYWILKNSWGSSWGEAGYFRFKYGVNECGITMDNAYPILN